VKACELCAHASCSVNVEPCRGCFDEPDLPNFTPEPTEPATFGNPERVPDPNDLGAVAALTCRIAVLAVRATALDDREHRTEAEACWRLLRKLCRKAPDYSEHAGRVAS